MSRLYAVVLFLHLVARLAAYIKCYLTMTVSYLEHYKDIKIAVHKQSPWDT